MLFCDLVGFTPISEARDAEEIRELLSRYFEIARTTITRFGGVVEKFIGDAVMAVWGTPVAAEGDGERAVRAALDLVAAVAQLGTEIGIDSLAARAGVVTGEVAVTIGAVNEGMVAGDAVNTAARVQAAAEAGTVLVDAATQRLASRAIGFEDVGLRALKGKAEPEALWRATWVLSGVGGAQRVDGLEVRMLGRDAELQTVKQLFHAAAERRVPRLLVVSGPAGVGKSRLGWEFEKYIDGLAGVALWHRGRCLSYGDGVTFWALAEVVRQRLGIAEEDSAAIGATKLAAGLAATVPDKAERAYVESRLARLLGVATSDDRATLAREELFAGWRLYFERLAAQHPVVILIEDAQRADAGLLDFLDHLVDWSHDLPIFVVVFTRPELEVRRTGFGTGRNRTTLTLDPLDGTSMRTLVDALVPGMPPAARDKIVRRAEGIPLFAVETIRSLVDRDIVQPRDGVYQLVGDVGELAVPDSLHGLLAARLDSLAPAVRALVADAAVLGSTFFPEALAAVAGRDEQAVRADLAELVRREVVDVSADPLSPERGTYRFAQEMLRQVAYETLSRRDRKARHLAVAAHLRAALDGDGEEMIDVVARHYLDALAAVPGDGDVAEITAEAVEALVRAGERAQRTGAPDRAGNFFAQAAELRMSVGSPEAELAGGAMWERAAAAYDYASLTDQMLTCSTAAEAVYRRHGGARELARAQAVSGGALRRLGRHTEARRSLAAALNVLRPDPDGDTVLALMNLAALETFAGAEDADRITNEALTLGQALGVDLALQGRSFINRGICLTMLGRRLEGVAYLREAARLAQLVGERRVQGLALLNQSDVMATDDPASAKGAAEAAIEVLRATGDRDSICWALCNLCYAHVCLGEWDEAAAAIERGAAQDALNEIAQLRVAQGWLAALRGDLDGVDEILNDLSALRASEDPQDRASVLRIDAFLAVARRQPAVTLATAMELLDTAGAIGADSEYSRWAWPLAARAAYELGDEKTTSELLERIEALQPGRLAPLQRAEHALVRARIAAGQGSPHAASAFAAAIAALRAGGTPYHLAHGLLDQAELLTTADAPSATAAVAEAEAIAERLGCRPLLARSEAVGAAVARVSPVG